MIARVPRHHADHHEAFAEARVVAIPVAGEAAVGLPAAGAPALRQEDPLGSRGALLRHCGPGFGGAQLVAEVKTNDDGGSNNGGDAERERGDGAPAQGVSRRDLERGEHCRLWRTPADPAYSAWVTIPLIVPSPGSEALRTMQEHADSVDERLGRNMQGIRGKLLGMTGLRRRPGEGVRAHEKQPRCMGRLAREAALNVVSAGPRQTWRSNRSWRPVDGICCDLTSSVTILRAGERHTQAVGYRPRGQWTGGPQEGRPL